MYVCVSVDRGVEGPRWEEEGGVVMGRGRTEKRLGEPDGVTRRGRT